jgi:hypothetical protein
MVGRLDGVNGKLEIVVTADALMRDLSGDAAVAENGDLTPIDPAVVRFIQDGKFDFDECTASGNWALGASASGTWRLELPDAAL